LRPQSSTDLPDSVIGLRSGGLCCRRTGDSRFWAIPDLVDKEMSFDIKRKVIRVWGLASISALAIILVAAGVDLDQNGARLRGLPREQRLKLIENLRRFDLVLRPEQQKALRDLDRRIAELPPAQRVQYLAALQRYSNWLNHLPENRRGDLLDKPPGERMPEVRKLVFTNPVPKVNTGRFLRIADLGVFSPFELAAVFKIWQVLTPDQRRNVEKLPVGTQSLEAIFRLGKAKALDREIKPAEFDEERWLTDVETYLRENRPALLLDDLKKRADSRHPQILRRLAINFYFLDKKQEVVNPDRLAAFVTAFPPFIQTSFEQFPPDEARRRLTIVYRLVFPPGEEVKPVPPATVPPAGARPTFTTPRGD
jgi:hypothetical protein